MFDMLFTRVLPSESLPQTYAYLIHGGITFTEGSETIADFMRKHEGEHLAIKRTHGCHGDNLMSVYLRNGLVCYDGQEVSLDEFVGRITAVPSAMWVMQGWLVQHEALAAFNASSVNTLRMVTYNTGERVVLSGTTLLAGPPNSLINNPAEGTETLYGITDKGAVCEYAYNFTPAKRSITPLAGKVLPFFADACELVKRAHSAIPEVFSVGWDVVITPAGPILLEGNDGWSPRALQVPLHRGERPTWDSLLKERESFYHVE